MTVLDGTAVRRRTTGRLAGSGFVVACAVGIALAPTAIAGTVGTTPSGAAAGWTLQSLPVPAAGVTTWNHVSGTSAADVWVTGTAYDATTSVNRAVAEHFDGTTWTVHNPPATSGWAYTLVGVREVAPGDVWAVGVISYQQAQVLHFRAGRWTIATTFPAYYNPRSIVAFSDADVWVAGSYTSPTSHSVGFAEHYTGSSWVATTLPAVFHGGYSGSLYQLTGTSSHDLWAVGAAWKSGTTVLVAHYNGTRWTPIATPTPGRRYADELLGATTLPSGDVWGVGYTLAESGSQFDPLVEHFDGRTWTATTAPGVAAANNVFVSVAPDAGTGLWAVGYTMPTGPAPTTGLIEHHTAGSWTIVPAPLAANAYSSLTAITTTGTVSWAVGSSAMHPEGVVLRNR